MPETESPQLFNKLISEKPEERDELQKEIFNQIQIKSGRKTLAYFANFKTYPHHMINYDDKSKIMLLMDSIPEGIQELDFILHSPGGFAESTEMIVRLLRSRFNNIRFIIPHSAKSAATMLALSGNNILMFPSSELGPIDPQVSGSVSGPAQTIIDGFNEIKKIVDKENKLNGAYVPLLNKMDVATLKRCEAALKYGITVVRDWIAKYMFENKGLRPAAKKRKARAISQFFSNHNKHLTHAKPITWEEAKNIGVEVDNIEAIDPELARMIKEYYLRFEFIFDNPVINKIYQSEKEYMVSRTPGIRLTGPIQIGPLPISPPLSAEEE